MKKHVTRLCLLLLVGLSFAACNNDKKNPTPPTAVKLEAPTGLQINERTLTWTAVANASGYNVEIDGTEYSVTGTTYSLSALTAPGVTWQIKIMAKGNVTNYTDSNWSAAIPYTFVPIMLYELPESLDVNIEIRNETGLLDYITKDVLALVDQVAVTDPTAAARHYVSYPMTEILAQMGISTDDLVYAFLEASDNPVAYNTTVTNFDDSYIAVVRITTATGEVQTSSNFPRFIAGEDGYVEGDKVLSLVGTITLNGTTDVLYPLPDDLDVNIEIRNETNLLGVITKKTLAFIDQVEVPDPANTATRHYVSYPMTEILDRMGISADFDSAFIEAWDNPVAYNTTVTSFDDAYIAVVRITTATGEVQTSSNFPRFIAGDGFVKGDQVLSNVGTITLGGGAPPPPPPPPSDALYDLPESLVVDIEVFCDMGVLRGTITKGMLESIDQVEVTDPQNGARHFVSYPLAEILALIDGIPAGFISVTGEAEDGYWATGEIDDAYIAVVRITTATGDVQDANNFPRLVVPSGQGFRPGDSTVRAPVVSNVIKLTLGK